MEEKRILSDEDIDLIKTIANTINPCNSCSKNYIAFCFCPKFDECITTRNKQLKDIDAHDLYTYVSHYKEFLQISEKILKLKNRETTLKKELIYLGIIPIPAWDEDDKK